MFFKNLDTPSGKVPAGKAKLAIPHKRGYLRKPKHCLRKARGFFKVILTFSAASSMWLEDPTAKRGGGGAHSRQRNHGLIPLKVLTHRHMHSIVYLSLTTQQTKGSVSSVGERLLDRQEVTGSNPVRNTIHMNNR